MADPVVADSGPLIAFGHLDRFDLFPDVLGQVLVPASVIQECLQKPARSDAVCIQLAIVKGWLVVDASNPNFLISLPCSLGEGECAAITLATKLGCPVLLDDKLARRAAQLVGVKVVGSVGVLLKAKQLGKIEQVATMLELLQSKGYHLSPDLIEQSLCVAGEQQ